MIYKPNDLKVFVNKETKEPKQNSQKQTYFTYTWGVEQNMQKK